MKGRRIALGTAISGVLLVGMQGMSSLCLGAEFRQEIYQTMTHCGDAADCRSSTKTPDCRLTLTYQDDQLTLVNIFGIGVNQADDRGFYSLSNDPSIYHEDSGPKLQKNEVKVRGDRIDTQMVATSLRWNVYREETSFKIRGMSPDKVASVEARFLVKLAGIPGAGIIVDCKDLARLNLDADE